MVKKDFKEMVMVFLGLLLREKKLMEKGEGLPKRTVSQRRQRGMK